MGRMVLGQFKDPEGNVIGLIEARFMKSVVRFRALWEESISH